VRVLRTGKPIADIVMKMSFLSYVCGNTWSFDERRSAPNS